MSRYSGTNVKVTNTSPGIITTARFTYDTGILLENDGYVFEFTTINDLTNTCFFRLTVPSTVSFIKIIIVFYCITFGLFNWF